MPKMNLEQYRARLVVKEFLGNPYLEDIKDAVEGVNWVKLQEYADEAKTFEKAPPEDRE